METALDQFCWMFAAQFDVLDVKRATVETGVDQFWSVPRDQFDVLLVKRATEERPLDTRPSNEDVPDPPLFARR